MKKQQKKQNKPTLTKEQLAQSEKISDLIAQIAGLTVKIENLKDTNEYFKEKLKESLEQNKKFKADIVRYIMEH